MNRLHTATLFLACLSIVLIVAAACVPVPQPAAAPTVAPTVAPTAAPAAAPSTTITDIVWQWTSVKDRPTGETTTVADPQNYTITFREDGTVSGKADCNTFTGTYSQEGGFTILTTPDVMAACGGDSLDIQYFNLLDAVVTGGPDGAGGLALETAGGEKRMTFVNGGAAAPTAAAAPTVAPTAAPAAAPSNTITDIVWQWTSVTTKPSGETTTVADPQNYTITFRKDGTLSGKADCNTFTGSYSQQNGFHISVTPTVMAACGTLDSQYLTLLKQVAAGGPDGAGGLALETAGGEKRMTFVNGGQATASTPTPSNTITNIVWQWTSVKDRPTGTTTTVSNPQNYTITFRADGTLSGKADCNTFTGTYSQQGGFFITAKPDVMAACGGDSLDIQYLA